MLEPATAGYIDGNTRGIHGFTRSRVLDRLVKINRKDDKRIERAKTAGDRHVTRTLVEYTGVTHVSKEIDSKRERSSNGAEHSNRLISPE